MQPLYLLSNFNGEFSIAAINVSTSKQFFEASLNENDVGMGGMGGSSWFIVLGSWLEWGVVEYRSDGVVEYRSGGVME